VTEIYVFIDAEYATCRTAPTITRMCSWLEVSELRQLSLAGS